MNRGISSTDLTRLGLPEGAADGLVAAVAALTELPPPEQWRRMITGPLTPEIPFSVHRFIYDRIYAGMVETMDSNVGRLMAKLEELGIADDTLVLFTSDNGGDNVSSQRPLTGCKGWLYEGGVRVPWIVKWPGVTEPGSTSDVPVTITDILPTVLEASGLPLRPDLHKDGVSIVPLLRGSDEPVHESLFWHFPHYGNHGAGPSSGVRMGDWKLIHWIESDRVELFNLATDLSEKNNAAAQHPEIAKNLRKRLETWRKETAANMPRPKL